MVANQILLFVTLNILNPCYLLHQSIISSRNRHILSELKPKLKLNERETSTNFKKIKPTMYIPLKFKILFTHA